MEVGDYLNTKKQQEEPQSSQKEPKELSSNQVGTVNGKVVDEQEPTTSTQHKETLSNGGAEQDKKGNLIPLSYAELGLHALSSQDAKFQVLLNDRKWPQKGWSDLSIEIFINKLAAQDSNNFLKKTGVGEREARIYSGIVARRHFNMGHGIGRSGDLAEPQPKAIGSTIVGALANALVLDLCRTIVSTRVKNAFVAPVATGMSMSLVLMALKKNSERQYVLWPRVDQKSCFKSILMTGLKPIILHGVLTDDEEVTVNLDEMESVLVERHQEILCVLSTTSCFAPRACDPLVDIAKLCKRFDLPLVVNNAYGIQSGICTNAIKEAHREGRLDVFVQSTDKNLMVPVGGSIIAGFNSGLLDDVRKVYPGRASSSASLDVLITMLSMGSDTYKELLKTRKENYTYLKTKMTELADSYGETIMKNPNNNISLAMTLDRQRFFSGDYTSQIGSMLFRRNVLGARVVESSYGKSTIIDGYEFKEWGSHKQEFSIPYLTAASTIGMEKSEVDNFVRKLDECLKALRKRKDQIKISHYTKGRNPSPEPEYKMRVRGDDEITD